jgi:antitoxin MazE
MQATVQKWGDSLAIRLPTGLISEIQLSENAVVDISLEQNRLVIKPVKPKYTLDELLAGVTLDNLHSEISTGHAVGKEVFW